MSRPQRFQTVILLMLVLLMMATPTSLAKKTKIVLQYAGGVANVASVTEWLSEFNETYPSVEVEFYPEPTDFASRTLVAWATGDGPDVASVCCDWGQDWARSGVLLDLRPFVKRDMSERDVRDFWPIAWNASFVTTGDYQGIQYCLPRYAITVVNYHNKDQCSAAGLPTPNDYNARGEWTYDTLRQMAKKLTVSTGQGGISRYGYTLNNADYRRLNVWVRAFGGEFFDLSDPQTFVGAEEEAVQGIDFLQAMIWQDRSTTPAFRYRDFYNGHVSMVEEGNHAVTKRFEVEIAGGFNWDIAPAPRGPNGRKAYTADNGWVIWRDSAHIEEAWQLVKFLTSTRGQEIMVRNEGIAPVRNSAMTAYQKLSPTLNLGGSHITNMMDPGPPTTTYLTGNVGEISKVLNKALGDVLVRNQKSWLVAASEIAPALEALARQK